MLDEPSLGLAPMAVARVYEKLIEIRSQGVAYFRARSGRSATGIAAKRCSAVVLAEPLLRRPAARAKNLRAALRTCFAMSLLRLAKNSVMQEKYLNFSLVENL